ncbi:MAG: tail fiber protein [Bacteroidia bacterium]|nr:tail fiber protein [Bacteroidia bacterium]
MNSINFFNEKKKFPLSTNVLDFLQNMVKQAHLLALIGGGDKYILTGCNQVAANTWAEGYVVVAGEVLPFTGGTGTAASSVRIKQTKADIVAEYDTYTEALTTRVLEFGSNVGNVDTFTWSDFTVFKTNKQIEAEYATKLELSALNNLLFPTGGVLQWPSVNLPTGFLMCDGATLNRADYPALFAIIGTQFGTTSELTFKLPDLRKRFVVGYDSTSLNTPNVTDQTENYGAIGNRGGRPNVQLTGAQSGVAPHAHNVKGYVSSGSGFKVLVQDNRNTNESETIIGTTDNAAAAAAAETHENRPPYFVLAYIIKVV